MESNRNDVLQWLVGEYPLFRQTNSRATEKTAVLPTMNHSIIQYITQMTNRMVTTYKIRLFIFTRFILRKSTKIIQV